MKLFSLTVDFAFKALFAPNPDLLISLINSFPSFQAENQKGEQFLIEMQAVTRRSFPKRILYYWSKVYSRSLIRNQKYEKLKRVYSINFLNEPLWKDRPEYFNYRNHSRIDPVRDTRAMDCGYRNCLNFKGVSN